MFRKDLFRKINGVVKADDDTTATVWQELDEYVVTRELSGHFRKFFTSYLEAIDDPNNPDIRNRIGVWVSGFFGSGKSHFIKIISYLLKNFVAMDPATGEMRDAVDFFESKIEDKIFLEDIRRAALGSADVILFNIDSKAVNSDSRDAILNVFMQVLNELQGYCPEYPYLADVERKLDLDGHYDKFKSSFEGIFGAPWIEERDAYEHRRDETVKALGEATGMSLASAGKLIDDSQANYSMSVEKFARRVKEYLDRKGKNHRLVFIADEVGQFIGSDTHLMLNLQTIVENLGTICNGRAWVVVTSQEDIDKVLGDVVGAQANDFSKIQGRFSTRISLSSSNTDEVIQTRLLEKTTEAEAELKALFAAKGDVLRHQLSFASNGANLKNFTDADSFSRNYPFAPYNYQLVQAVFESIRKAGASGLHLARGERSMLDAFQHGAMTIAGDKIGKLVPFYAFYPSVESFLDTAVKRTIDQASEDESLEPFDTNILRLLFLIRYVDIFKPSIDNLVTLCISQVDDDRIALKRQLEESLRRLQKRPYVSRNGEFYYFLTNEEKDVENEIRNVDISADQIAAALSKYLFEDVMPGAEKYTYPVNKKVFNFNRSVDSRPYQGVAQHELTIDVITPLNFEYDSYTAQKCVLDSTGQILLKIANKDGLSDEIRLQLKTQRYIQQKSDAAAPPTIKRILRDKAEENQQRQQRIIQDLNELIENADYFVAGQNLSSENRTSIPEAQSYLIKNLYSKLGYLNAPAADPIEEIKSVLLADDVGQQTLGLDAGQPNSNALKEIHDHIELRTNSDMRLSLDDIIKSFEKQPYGWRNTDTALLVSKLFVAGELTVKIEGAAVEPRASIDFFTKPGRWNSVGLFKRRTTGSADLAAARKLAHDVFGKLGSDTSEDSLAAFIRGEVRRLQESLRDYRTRAETGEYPGLKQINAVLELANSQAAIADTFEFFRQFNEKSSEWQGAREDYAMLSDFYRNQIDIWQRTRSKMIGSFKDNRPLLDLDPKSKEALRRLEEILATPKPYGLIAEIHPLIAEVDKVNQQILASRRTQAIASIETKIDQLRSELDSIHADSDTRHSINAPFQQIKSAIETEESIQRIAFQEGENSESVFRNALEIIENKRPKDPDAPAAELRVIRSLKPADLNKKAFIESTEDIDEFLKALRAEMEELLKENARIRIQ